MTAMAMAIAVVVLFPLMVLLSAGSVLPSLSAKAWTIVLFLGTLAGAVQFSLFTWALRWLPPTTTVLYPTLNPVTAMLLGVMLIGESLTVALVTGLALVITAILIGSGVVANLRGRLRAQDTPTE